jgi:hypothetical protein
MIYCNVGIHEFVFIIYQLPPVRERPCVPAAECALTDFVSALPGLSARIAQLVSFA